MKYSNSKVFISALLLCGALASQVLAGPVSYYGRVQATGGKIKNQAGNANVQLRGPSLYWSEDLGGPLYTQSTVDWFVDNMDISVIRAAMAIKYYDYEKTKLVGASGNFGYLSDNNANAKAIQKARIKAVVDAAILNDIYVIVDWHSHNAEEEQSAATAFFTEMANEYANVPNIIWEVFNEPVYQSNDAIYNYAAAVIQAIRGTGNQNLVLVGSREWSKLPGEIAGHSNALHTRFTNVGYTFHFYAASHTGGASNSIAGSANSAVSKGAAVFASEWGTTNFDGKTNVSASESQSWLSYLDANSIGHCNWAVLGNSDASSMFTSVVGGLKTSSLSQSGQIFNTYMQGKKGQAPTGFPWGKSITRTVKEGDPLTLSLTDVSATSGATFDGIENLDATEGTATASGSTLSHTMPAVGVPAIISFNYFLKNGSNRSRHRISLNVDRKPLAKDTIIEVSYLSTGRAIATSNLGVSDPDGKDVTFTAAGGGTGTSTLAADKKSFTYIPPANFLNGAEYKDDLLTYTVTDGSTTNTKSLTIRVRDMIPTVYATSYYTIGNDTSFHISMAMIKGKDAETAIVNFTKANIRHSSYAGTLAISADKQMLTFTPQAGKTGKLAISFQISDGKFESKEGLAVLTITGSGAAFTYEPYTPVVTMHSVKMGMATTDLSGISKWGASLYLNQSSALQLDVLTVNGQLVRTLNLGKYEEGFQQLNWDLGGLNKGLYILRVRGSNFYQTGRLTIQ